METLPATARRTAAGEAARPAQEARRARTQALAGARRALVLDAARSAFFELGMERASMREIAQRAGYTPGAIYGYFSSKEAMYGALLGESLDRLNERVQQPHGPDTDVQADIARPVRRIPRAVGPAYRAIAETEMNAICAETSVLVLVDYQARLMPAISEVTAVTSTAVLLARAARVLGVPVPANASGSSRMPAGRAGRATTQRRCVGWHSRERPS